MPKTRAGSKGYSFKWTAEEWAILEPMTEAERMKWCLQRIFQSAPKKAKEQATNNAGSVQA